MTAPHGDDERLRELLADARASGPMPADVAARLDDVLGDLRRDADQEHAEPALAPVLPFRRRAARALVAAAAVLVLGGFAVSQIVDNGGSGGADSAASGAAADAGVTQESGGPQESRAGKDLAARPGLVPARLRSAHFAADVRRLLGSVTASLAESQDAIRRDERSKVRASCAVPAGVRTSTVQRVRVDGRPATLVVRGSGRDRVATAYSCDGGAVLARAPLR